MTPPQWTPVNLTARLALDGRHPGALSAGVPANAADKDQPDAHTNKAPPTRPGGEAAGVCGNALFERFTDRARWQWKAHPVELIGVVLGARALEHPANPVDFEQREGRIDRYRTSDQPCPPTTMTMTMTMTMTRSPTTRPRRTPAPPGGYLRRSAVRSALAPA